MYGGPPLDERPPIIPWPGWPGPPVPDDASPWPPNPPVPHVYPFPVQPTQCKKCSDTKFIFGPSGPEPCPACNVWAGMPKKTESEIIKELRRENARLKRKVNQLLKRLRP